MSLSDDAAAAIRELRIVCGVCARQLSKYGCPRCNKRTCSLECYKAHSTACTELFAADNVTQAMKGLRVDEQQRRQFASLLRRVHDEWAEEDESPGGESSEASGDEGEDVDEKEPGVLSSATLERLASSAAPSLQDLTAAEQAAFQRAVRNGSFSHLLTPWEPWWLTPGAGHIALRADGTALVQLVETDNHHQDDAPLLPPPPQSALPRVASLTAGQVSPLLACHVADVLAAYTLSLGAYNGDWTGDEPGAADTMLGLSPVLASSAVGGNPSGDARHTLPVTPAEAVAGVRHRAQSEVSFAPHASHMSLDVVAILTCGRGALVCALEHARALMAVAAAEAKGASKEATRAAALRRVERKLFFLTAWAADESTRGAQGELLAAVEIDDMSERGSAPRAAAKAETTQRRRMLVEEVSST